MRTLTAAVSATLLLASCGIASKNPSSSAAKNATAAKADYLCIVQSTLDGTAPEPERNFYEAFDFKGADMTVTKNIGVTNGNQYAASISREHNSKGDRINLILINVTSKASSVAQYSEGSQNLFLTMTPDGKFQATVYCEKK